MRRIAHGDRARIRAKVEQYARDPASLRNQMAPLTGSPYSRLRVGNYRVIFDIRAGQIAVMVVLRVRHRRNAYDFR